MQNAILLLVLISGLLSGYLIGDYRGKEARQALENTLRTGQTLDKELRAANANLKSDLDEANEKYKQDLEKLRNEYSTRSDEWQHVKNGLDETINRQSRKLAELNQSLNELIAKLGGSSAAEKGQLELKIAVLRKEIDDLLREVDGNVCLEKQVPQSVIHTLNAANSPESN